MNILSQSQTISSAQTRLANEIRGYDLENSYFVGLVTLVAIVTIILVPYQNLFNSLSGVTHIYAGYLTIIGSDNGLSPGRRQAITWTNAGTLLIRTLGTNFSEIFSEVHTFSFKKMHLKMSSAKWRPFCLSLNVLSHCNSLEMQLPMQASSWIVLNMSKFWWSMSYEQKYKLLNIEIINW